MPIAVMHDLIEDKPEWTAERLAAEGFSQRVISGGRTQRDPAGPNPSQDEIVECSVCGGQ